MSCCGYYSYTPYLTSLVLEHSHAPYLTSLVLVRTAGDGPKSEVRCLDSLGILEALRAMAAEPEKRRGARLGPLLLVLLAALALAEAGFVLRNLVEVSMIGT